MPAVREWVDPAGVPVRVLTRRSPGRWKDLFFAMEVAWALWRDRNRYDVVYFLMQGLHLTTGLPCEKLFWMPNPVNTDEFQPAPPNEIAPWRVRHGISPQSTVAIYLGRLSHEKGLPSGRHGFGAGFCGE